MNLENKKKLYGEYLETPILKFVTEHEDDIIDFPYEWKLEDNKFSFNIYISLQTYSTGKNVRIYIDLIDYNDKFSTELYKEDTLMFKNFSKSVEKSTVIDFIVDFFINFRSKYQFSKIFDRVLKKTTPKCGNVTQHVTIEDEDKHLFFFKEADPYRDTNCCVCSDDSLTFTSCDHNLCRICFSNLTVEFDDCSRWKNCPLCRHVFNCSE